MNVLNNYYELIMPKKEENTIVYLFSYIKEYIDNYIVIEPYQWKPVNKINKIYFYIVHEDY